MLTFNELIARYAGNLATDLFSRIGNESLPILQDIYYIESNDGGYASYSQSDPTASTNIGIGRFGEARALMAGSGATKISKTLGEVVRVIPISATYYEKAADKEALVRGELMAGTLDVALAGINTIFTSNTYGFVDSLHDQDTDPYVVRASATPGESAWLVRWNFDGACLATPPGTPGGITVGDPIKDNIGDNVNGYMQAYVFYIKWNFAACLKTPGAAIRIMNLAPTGALNYDIFCDALARLDKDDIGTIGLYASPAQIGALCKDVKTSTNSIRLQDVNMGPNRPFVRTLDGVLLRKTVALAS